VSQTSDTLRTVKEVPKLGPYLVFRLGKMRRASKCARFIGAWGIAYEDLHLGRAITIEEYAEYWGMSLATAYRDWALFKEVWPRDFSVLRVWKWCRAQVPERDRAHVDMAAAQLWNARSLA
jgi:hypothetical protein